VLLAPSRSPLAFFEMLSCPRKSARWATVGGNPVHRREGTPDGPSSHFPARVSAIFVSRFVVSRLQPADARYAGAVYRRARGEFCVRAIVVHSTREPSRERATKKGMLVPPADAAPPAPDIRRQRKKPRRRTNPETSYRRLGQSTGGRLTLLANLCENERPKMSIAPKRRPMRFTPEPHGRSIRHVPGRADIGTAMIAHRAQHGACLIDKPHLGIARQCRGWSFAKTP
jgi:hypothetical protein